MVGKFTRTALVSLALAFGGVSASPACEYSIVESSVVGNGTIVQLSLTNTTSSSWNVGQQFQLDLGSPNLIDIGFNPENSVEIINNSKDIYTFQVLETPKDSVLQMIVERKCSESSDYNYKDDCSAEPADCSTSVSLVCKDSSQGSTARTANALSAVKQDNADDSEFGTLWWRRRGWGRTRRPVRRPPSCSSVLVCPVNVQHTLAKSVPCNGTTSWAAYIPPNSLRSFPTGALDWELGRFLELTSGKAAVSGVLFNKQRRFRVYIHLSGRQFDKSGLVPFTKSFGSCTPFDTSSWYFYRRVRGWMVDEGDGSRISLSNRETRPAQLGVSANVRNDKRGLGLWLKASNRFGEQARIDFNSDISCNS